MWKLFPNTLTMLLVLLVINAISTLNAQTIRVLSPKKDVSNKNFSNTDLLSRSDAAITKHAINSKFADQKNTQVFGPSTSTTYNIGKTLNGLVNTISGKQFYGYDVDTMVAIKFVNPFPKDFQKYGTNSISDYVVGSTFNTQNVLYAVYMSNKLVKVDTSTGLTTLIGTMTPKVSDVWTGLTIDKTSGIMYATSASSAGSTIYSVNPANASVTPLAFGAAYLFIDIVIGPNGNFFTIDINSDKLYEIEKNTYIVTEKGPLGIDAKYAQGMAFDHSTSKLYWSAHYNYNGVYVSELRELNITNGSSIVIGAFKNNDEIDGLAIPFYDPPTPYIVVSYPNGGEKLVAGSTNNIVWSQYGVNNVKLEYTTDNGAVWVPISASVPAKPETYFWIVPNTLSSQCKIKITDVASTSSDMSNGTFTISTPPPIGDTLFYGNSPQCLKATKGGWVIGNNGYGDLGKAQRFDLTSSITKTLNSAKIYFGAKQIIGTPDNFNLKVWSVGTNGAPNTVLYSGVFSLANVDTSRSGSKGTIIPIIPAIQVTGPFFIGVDWNQSVVNDTFGIVYDNYLIPPAGENQHRGWEKLSDSSWYPIDDSVNSWGFNSDIWIAAIFGSSYTNPTISVSVPSISFGTVVINTYSSIQKYTLSGNNLLSNILITAPTGFEVSTDSTSGFGSSITVIPSSGLLSDKTIFARFRPTDVSTKSGNIIHESQNATPKNVSVSGTGKIDYQDSLSVNFALTFGSSDQQTSYKLFGISGNSNLLLSEIIPGTFDKDWVAYNDPGSFDYEKYTGSDKFRLKAGKGFWLLSKNPITINRWVKSNQLNQTDSSTTIEINSDWNIITNPFDRDVDWNKLLIKNGIDSAKTLYSYNSGIWEKNNQVMKQNQGYYFFNFHKKSTLKVPYTVSGLMLKPNEEKSDETEMKIKISQKGKIIDEVGIGFSVICSDAFDSKDELSPGSDFQDISIRIISPKIRINKGELYSEYRKELGKGQEYDLRVLNNTGNSFAFSFVGNIDTRVILINSQTLQKTELIKDKEIIIQSNAKEIKYRMLTGSNEYINEKLNETIPSEFSLAQNYPNPFNPSTVINYQLPVLSNVTLKIYDLLGREIETLINEQKPAGSYNVEWNATKYSSGVYYFELRAGNYCSIKKMMLMK